jgi:hypothetical protein
MKSRIHQQFAQVLLLRLDEYLICSSKYTFILFIHQGASDPFAPDYSVSKATGGDDAKIVGQGNKEKEERLRRAVI